MKSLAELQALRDKMKNNMGVRGDDTGNIRARCFRHLPKRPPRAGSPM